MRKFVVMKALVLNIRHLTRQTFEAEYALPLNAQYDFGAFIYIADPDENYPEDLRIIAEWIAINAPDCSWARFDSAGEFIDQLPDYSSTWIGTLYGQDG